MDSISSKRLLKLQRIKEEKSTDIKLKFLKQDLKELESGAFLPDAINSYTLQDFLENKNVLPLSYKNKPIKEPFFSGLNDGVKQEAVDIFKTILLITSKNLSVDKVKQYGDIVVRKSMEVMDLRDEVLIQILNQMHVIRKGLCKDQDRVSLNDENMEVFKNQAWVLLAGCLSCFRPSSQLFLQLLNFLSKEDDIEKRAACQHNLLQNFFFSHNDLTVNPLSLEERSHPPCLLEWMGYELNASVALNVVLVDGQTFYERVHSWMTTEQFAHNGLVNYLNIPQDHCKGWSVTLHTFDKSYEGQGHDCLLDLVSEVEANRTLELTEKYENTVSNSDHVSNSDASISSMEFLNSISIPVPPLLPIQPITPQPLTTSAFSVEIDEKKSEKDETVLEKSEFVQKVFDTLLDGYDQELEESFQARLKSKTNDEKQEEYAEPNSNSSQTNGNVWEDWDEEETQRKKIQKSKLQTEQKILEVEYLKASIEAEKYKNELKKLESKKDVNEIQENQQNTEYDSEIKKEMRNENKNDLIDGTFTKLKSNLNKDSVKPDVLKKPQSVRESFKYVSWRKSKETKADPEVRIGKIVWPPVKKEIHKTVHIIPSKLLIDEVTPESSPGIKRTPPKAAVKNNSSKNLEVPEMNNRKQKFKDVKGKLEEIYGSCSSMPNTIKTTRRQTPEPKPLQYNKLSTPIPFSEPPSNKPLKILPLPSKPILTYSDSEWTLEIKKEFFYPGERLYSPVCIDLLFKQIYKDTYDNSCVRLTENCKEELKKTFKKFKKENSSMAISERTKVEVIENATYLPVYFSKVFAVQDMRDQQIKFLVLTAHSLSLLFKHKKSMDELIFEFTIPYENIDGVTMKDLDSLMIRSTQQISHPIKLHIHTPNALIINNLIQDYKMFVEQFQASEEVAVK